MTIAPWVAQYRRSWLAPDAIAGVTLAAYGLPVSMAYAGLAGLPPESGIYCYLAGGLAYALFGSCGQLAIGPTSAISMLVGATVAPMAGGDPQRWAHIAALAAGLVAVVSLIAWVLRLSAVVNFISETILTGFKAGAAITIAMTQLPKLFGVPGGGDHFFERCWALATQLPQTNAVILLFGLCVIALLVAGERYLPGRPVANVVVALSIAVISWTSLGAFGIPTTGELPAKLPDLQLLSLRAREVDGSIGLAFACFLLAYIEGISAARAISRRHGYQVDARRELLALGAANFAAAFSQGFPVTGGLSQSAVNDRAGAKSPLSLVFASATLAIFLLFFTAALANLPTLVLAGIVLVAVKGLINVPELRRLWLLSRTEFWIAMAALAGVLTLGILRGVLLAAFISLLVLIVGAARPQIAFLGRLPEAARWASILRHPDALPLDGILVFRVEAGIFYFNTDHIRAAVLHEAGKLGARLAVCDLSSTPRVDLAGLAMFDELDRSLAAQGAVLRIAEAHAETRALFVRAGFGRLLGTGDEHASIDAAIAASPAKVQ